MSSDRDWARAFFAQAQSDWLAYRQLSASELPACHALHALQMTLEKLGKALLLSAGKLAVERIEVSHRSFVVYLSSARFDRRLRQEWGRTRAAWAAMCDSVARAAAAIERLHPQLAQGGENVEYPWKAIATGVVAPAAHTFRAQRELRSPQGVRMLQFVEACLAYHSTRTFPLGRT